MADSKKYDGSQWEHSLRKLTTATEAVENPLYSDGTAITSYTLKGNTVQNGTPTPSNPVEVQGVGVRTENIFNGNAFFNSITSVSGNGTLTYSDNTFTLTSVDSASTYTIPSVTGNYYSMPVKPNTTYTLIFTNTNGQIFLFENAVYSQSIGSTAARRTFTTRSDTTFLSMALYIRNNLPVGTVATFSNIMLLEGDVNPSEYIPYGFKIPILTAQTTTPIYLSKQLMKIDDTVDSLISTGTVTYNIKKLVLDGSEDWRIEDVDNFYNYTIINDAVKKSYVICTHQQSIDTAYHTGNENTWISSSGRLNFSTTAVTHTVNAFKQWLADQYAAGTPVTVWYVLATPTTESVTAPSIPTVDGANQISIDTTVQPSEFTATWTGWHDSSVQEYDGTNWQ